MVLNYMFRVVVIIIGLLSFSLAAAPFSDNLLTSSSKTGSGTTSDTTPLRIAVASNFSPVLEKVLPLFFTEYGVKTQLISASSGTLFLQIKHGAPFDIFLSADNIRPRKLSDEDLTIPNSIATYAIGRLALWSAKTPFNIASDTLPPKTVLSPLVAASSRFAIANPELAPYGKAAKETLEYLDLWTKVNNKLVMGININQTFQQVRSKAVNSGLVALSQLKLNNLEGITIPASHHKAIEQQLVIIKSSKKVAQAQQLSDFLLKDTTQSLLSEYGYQAINSANMLNKTASKVSTH